MIIDCRGIPSAVELARLMLATFVVVFGSAFWLVACLRLN
jgi:hypothetical protein